MHIISTKITKNQPKTTQDHPNNRPKKSDQLLTMQFPLKFIYSEKVTKFCEIFPLISTKVHTVKSEGKSLQNFVTFSEYMKFKEI